MDTYEVTNGQYNIKAKISFIKSNELSINVLNEEKISLIITQSKWQLLIIIIFLAIVFLKFSEINFWLWLSISILLLFLYYFLGKK